MRFVISGSNTEKWDFSSPLQDRLEIVDKEVVDAELQVGALKRRIALLEEETTRSQTRLQENLEKLSTIEKVRQTKC